jgi:hypothetical protein
MRTLAGQHEANMTKFNLFLLLLAAIALVSSIAPFHKRRTPGKVATADLQLL